MTPSGAFSIPAVTVMIGSMNAPVVSAAAAPGYVGRYLVTMTVSNGVPSGTALLQLSMPPLAKAEQKSLQRMENGSAFRLRRSAARYRQGGWSATESVMALVETTGKYAVKPHVANRLV